MITSETRNPESRPKRSLYRLIGSALALSISLVSIDHLSSHNSSASTIKVPIEYMSKDAPIAPDLALDEDAVLTLDTDKRSDFEPPAQQPIDESQKKDTENYDIPNLNEEPSNYKPEDTDIRGVIEGLGLSKEDILDLTKKIEVVKVGTPYLIKHPEIEGLYALPVNKVSSIQDKFYWFEKYVGKGERYANLTTTRGIATVVQAWHAVFPDQPLALGDLTASGHLSHNQGNDVDVDTFTMASMMPEGSEIAANYRVANYNGEYWGERIHPGDYPYSEDKTVLLTTLFLRLIDSNGDYLVSNIFFGDNANMDKFNSIHKRLETIDAEQGTHFASRFQFWDKHNDHLHVRFNMTMEEKQQAANIAKQVPSIENIPIPEEQRM